MEEAYIEEAVRERLIIAGIRELETHGLNDFSLRRVAVACGVSCAAPYRHFKDKDELLLEIIRYINRQWTLLQDQIKAAFANDELKCLVETGVAHIRFWIANPKFRSILLLDDPVPNSDRHIERNKISNGIDQMVHAYCQKRGIPQNTVTHKAYAFQALIYGSVLMLGNQELANDETTFAMIRTQLEKILRDDNQ